MNSDDQVDAFINRMLADELRVDPVVDRVVFEIIGHGDIAVTIFVPDRHIASAHNKERGSQDDKINEAGDERSDLRPPETKICFVPYGRDQVEDKDGGQENHGARTDRKIAVDAKEVKEDGIEA